MIKSALQSSLTNDIKYRSMSAGAVPSNEYLITTTLITQNTPSTTISNISQYAGIYDSLKLVVVGRTTRGYSTENDTIMVRFNGDSGTNYNGHWIMVETGSSVGAGNGANMNYLFTGYSAAAPDLPAQEFGTYVMDILQPFSTVKFKTTRTLFGHPSSQTPKVVGIASGCWRSLAQVDSIYLAPTHGPGVWELAPGTRISLYGVTK